MEKGIKIASGRTAEVFEFSNNKILKLFKEGVPRTIIDREYRINQTLMKTGISMPKCYDFIDDKIRPGIVYERINGKSMMEILSARVWKLNSIARRFARRHFDIQRKVEPDLTDNKSQLKKNIGISDILTPEAKNKLCSYIDTLPGGDILCHGDFHPDNIIISNHTDYVIDWMTATRGNPCSDVARTFVLFRYGVIPEDRNIIEKAIVKVLREKFLAAYLKEYLHLSNFKMDDIEKWILPHIAARLIEWIPPQEKEVLHRQVTLKLENMN